MTDIFRMNYTEEAVTFPCEGQALVGVLAKPESPQDIGVVVIVGGPQYRAGSHRQFVLLSRALAVAGFAVLRFDYRGMGDSEGEQRDFESASVDGFGRGPASGCKELVAVSGKSESPAG